MMKITIEVDDIDCATDVMEALRQEAESIGLIGSIGTANMLRGVADQIENLIEDAIPETVEGRVELARQMIQQDAYTIHGQFPFILGAGDYHAFDDMQRILNQLFNDVNFTELTEDRNKNGKFACLEMKSHYVAVFYLGDTAPEVTQDNINSFRKVQA